MFKPRITIRKVSPSELAELDHIEYPRFPVTAYAAWEGRTLAATFGLGWGFGACWLWFSFKHHTGTHPVYVVREAKRMLLKAVQLGEAAVFAMRDNEPTSERLLKSLGFKYVAHDDLGLGLEEIWQWRHSQQSHLSSPSAPPLLAPVYPSTLPPRKMKARRSKRRRWKALAATSSLPPNATP